MEDFHNICRAHMTDWFNHTRPLLEQSQKEQRAAIDMNQTFIVWSCKTLQNYKAILSTSVRDAGIIAEYTYNGDKKELYEDVYQKLTNTVLK